MLPWGLGASAQTWVIWAEGVYWRGTAGILSGWRGYYNSPMCAPPTHTHPGRIRFLSQGSASWGLGCSVRYQERGCFHRRESGLGGRVSDLKLRSSWDAQLYPAGLCLVSLGWHPPGSEGELLAHPTLTQGQDVSLLLPTQYLPLRVRHKLSGVARPLTCHPSPHASAPSCHTYPCPMPVPHYHTIVAPKTFPGWVSFALQHL